MIVVKHYCLLKIVINNCYDFNDLKDKEIRISPNF